MVEPALDTQTIVGLEIHVQLGIQVYFRDPPLLTDLKSSQMAVPQPLGHRALVHLKALGNIERC